MLGLARIQKNINKIKKKKKIIYSFTLSTLLVFSGLLGIFIHIDNTFVYAGSGYYSDDFNDNSFDDDKWNATTEGGASITETNQELQFSASAGEHAS